MLQMLQKVVVVLVVAMVEVVGVVVMVVSVVWVVVVGPYLPEGGESGFQSPLGPSISITWVSSPSWISRRYLTR